MNIFEIITLMCTQPETLMFWGRYVLDQRPSHSFSSVLQVSSGFGFTVGKKTVEFIFHNNNDHWLSDRLFKFYWYFPAKFKKWVIHCFPPEVIADFAEFRSSCCEIFEAPIMEGGVGWGICCWQICKCLARKMHSETSSSHRSDSFKSSCRFSSLCSIYCACVMSCFSCGCFTVVSMCKGVLGD